MGAPKKHFFRRRTVPQIKNLDATVVSSPGGLSDQILNLSENQSLILNLGFTPERLYSSHGRIHERNKQIRDGFYSFVPQPTFSEIERGHFRLNSYDFQKPSDMVLNGIYRDLSHKDETNVFMIGFSYHMLTQKKNNRRVFIPFTSLYDGIKLYAYSEISQETTPQFARGAFIEGDISEIIKGNSDTLVHGATIPVRVPSTRKNSPGYQLKWNNVPLRYDDDNLKTPWNMYTQFGPRCGINDDTRSDLPATSFHNYGAGITENEAMIYPQDIAGLSAVIRDFNSAHNSVPFVLSPFPIITREAADVFYKLDNNVIVHDPCKKTEKGYRHLHLPEKCILFSRIMRTTGPHRMLKWDSQRDGNVRNYNFTLE